MGYHTFFNGEFELDDPLTVEQKNTLEEFARERHEGSGFPSLYCQWVPSDDGKCIVWDESEKFYQYAEWLEYLVENFIKPWGHNLNGLVYWDGEDREDSGTLSVNDNVVEEVCDELVPEDEVEIAGRKAVHKEIGKDLNTLLDYAVINEAEDFLENIGEYFEDENDDGIEAIYNAMVRDKLGDRELLALIEEHIENCSHIYVTILRLNAWLCETSTECECKS